MRHLNKNTPSTGTTIEYLAYKRKGVKELQVIKVISIASECWDENICEHEIKQLVAKNNTKTIELIQTQVKEVRCKVVSMGAKEIILSNGNDRYNVQFKEVGKIESKLNVGDYVELTAIFPVQNLSISGDLLEVIGIQLSNVDKYSSNNEHKNTDKRWVEIKCNSVPEFSESNSTQIMEVFIVNQRTQPVTLMTIEMLEQDSGRKHKYVKLLTPELYANGYKLEGNTTHMIELLIQSEARKCIMLLLVLHFDKFKMKRFLCLIGKDDKSICSISKVSRPNLSELPKRRCNFVRIQDYEVPEDLFKAFFLQTNNSQLNDYVHINYMFLNGEFNSKNYKNRLELFMHLEELQLHKNFRQYDCNDARFLKEGEYLSLLIDNLQERRPSLVVGDIVEILDEPESDSKHMKVSDGVIQKVLLDRIYIKFNPQFHASYNEETYNLKFKFSRYVLRKMHHAVNIVSIRQPSYLFPTKLVANNRSQLQATLINEELTIGHKTSPWFNKDLNINQKRAICNVLRGEMSMPYCIFGPPGTGKTVTVVETILQLRQNLTKSYILVAAPSNSAANIIASRLLKCKPQIQLLRLVSFMHMEKEMIPAELLKYSATLEGNSDTEQMSRNSDGVILRCTAEYLSKFHLLIGTCVTLGSLMQMKFSVDHFTHAVIDEAAQCIEPEFMCVASLLGSGGQLILSGDPQQLPPIVHNVVASNAGLSVSYMERILDLEPYVKNKQVFPNTNGFDSRLVTMLIYNYRSLPSILNVYNYLFYDHELIPVLKKNNAKELRFLNAGQDAIKEVGEGVKDKELPLYHGTYFCALKSTNVKASDSPSWFNELEAKHVYCTTMSLLARGIDADNIGIIAPYIKQVRFIRSLFQDTDTAVPKIGTIEEFQGQERAIILISTVRTRKGNRGDDRRKLELGFLSLPNRMNVAISRARALVIVFGNPSLLCEDEIWFTFIKYTYTNLTCYGDTPSLTFLKEIMEKEN